jgi:hypothetical protein
VCSVRLEYNTTWRRILPDATDTLEECLRSWHDDLASLDLDDLLAELELVRLSWARAVYCRRRDVVNRGAMDWIPAVEWLHQRGERLRAELRRRGAR